MSMLAILFSVHISLVTSNSVPNIGNQFDGDCFEYGIDYIGFDLDDGHYVSTENAAACQIAAKTLMIASFGHGILIIILLVGENGGKEKHG